MSPQAEFGLLPAIRSLWCGFKPSVSKLCRAGQRLCSTSRPRAGFMVLSPDRVWEQRSGGEREETRREKESEYMRNKDGRGSFPVSSAVTQLQR